MTFFHPLGSTFFHVAWRLHPDVDETKLCVHETILIAFDKILCCLVQAKNVHVQFRFGV